MHKEVRNVMRRLAKRWNRIASNRDPAEGAIDVYESDLPSELTVDIHQKSSTPNPGMKGAPPESDVKMTVMAFEGDRAYKFHIFASGLGGRYEEDVLFSPELENAREKADEILNTMTSMLSDGRVYVSSRRTSRRCPKCGRSKRATSQGCPKLGRQKMDVYEFIEWLQDEAERLEMIEYELPEDWDDVDHSEDEGVWQPGAAVLTTARRLRKRYVKLMSKLYNEVDRLEKGIRDKRL